MKKTSLFITIFLTTSCLFAQQQFDVTVRNIIVPMRVYEGNTFINDLKIDDLELFENGVEQKIQAIYLIRNTKIDSMEGERDFMPYVGRRFYFIFKITEFNPKISDVLDYYFSNVYNPQDVVTVMTPLKNYTLSSDYVRDNKKSDIINSMVSTIRKDTKLGATEYNNILKNMVRIASSIGGNSPMSGGNSLGGGIDSYRQALLKMEELRRVDEKKYIQIAAQLRRQEGQNNLFFFYQREFRPTLRSSALDRLVQMYQNDVGIIDQINDLFQFYYRAPQLNVERLQKIFADSSILFNLIYINKDPVNVPSNVQMKEQSEDLYGAFSKIAEATGGITDRSQNPAVSFEKAVEAAKSYYLIYYSPKDYVKDDKFREISIKIRNKKYKVIHRKGYLAN